MQGAPASTQQAEAQQRADKLAELVTLRQRVRQLEDELIETPPPVFQPTRYYTAYYATTGFLLGMFGAAISLLFNVVGSLIYSQVSGQDQHPLRLIQVYLTFPLGERALEIDNGLLLAIGCCLYLATGMIYGMIFHLILTRYTANASFLYRFVVVSVLAIVLWLVNFYGILSWLQPLLFGGNWILTEIPPWVAALTHIVFGWTMLVLYPFGLFVPYRAPTELG